MTEKDADQDKTPAAAPVSKEPRVITEAEVHTAGKQAESKPVSKPGMSGPQKFVLFVCLLIALAAAALSAWMYRELFLLPTRQGNAQIEQLQQQHNQRFQAVSASLSEQENALRGLERELGEQGGTLSQLRVETRQNLLSLNKQQQSLVETVSQLSSVDRADWLLAEAEFLLRLATQRAQLNRDASAAAKLLSSADQILLELDDAGLYPVRSALAEEVAALRGVAEFDVEGIYLRLQAMIGSAEALSLYRPPVFEPEPQVAELEGDWQQRLQAGFGSAWNKLSSYIRVRHHDADFRPTLAPEQEAALRASVRMMLEQAQLALLSERQAVFATALAKTAETVQRYYVMDERREVVATELAALGQLNVERSLPEAGAALTAFKAYLSQRRWNREVGQ